MFSFDSSKPVLVFLAGGVQGQAVVRACVARGLTVRALVRNPSYSGHPVHPAIELWPADLSDPLSIQAACAGLSHAVVSVPTDRPDAMAAQAAPIFEVLKAAQLRSFVLKLASASRQPPCEEPSFVGNALVEALARDTGIRHAVLRPTMYLENLLKPSARADIVERGVFSPPIAASQRIAWTCVEDCAEAAVLLLMGGGEGNHRIAGPESLDGEALAMKIAAGLRRPVRYEAQPIDAFERELDEAFGPGIGGRIASKFRYFEANPLESEKILAAPFEPAPELDLFVPTTVDRWVARHRLDFLGDDAGLSAAAATY